MDLTNCGATTTLPRLTGRLGALLVSGVAMIAVPSAVLADCAPGDPFKVLASDAAEDVSFGLGVSIDGDTAMVGGVSDDENGSDAGAVYVFVRDAGVWGETQKLLAPDGAADAHFGNAIDIDGDLAIVGAWTDGAGASGAAYIFRRTGTTWAFETKLVASDASSGAWLGYSVALSGDVGIVGAWGEGHAGPLSGAAYVFRFASGVWEEEAKLTAADGAVVDFYGFSVGIAGDVAMVGAVGQDGGAAEGGAVYVYRAVGSNWSQDDKLIPNDDAANDQFGTSIQMDGGRAVIASWGDDNGAGAVYIYEDDGLVWGQMDRLVASDRFAGDGFGWSVGLEGDRLIVGADTDDDFGNSSGAAYLWEFDGVDWIENAKVYASDAAADDNFGWAVGLSGDTVLCGAPNNTDQGEMTGAAYFIELDCSPPCLADLNGDGDVGFGDLLMVLANWSLDPNTFAGDIDGDGAIGFADLVLLLAAWGPCAG